MRAWATLLLKPILIFDVQVIFVSHLKCIIKDIGKFLLYCLYFCIIGGFP